MLGLRYGVVELVRHRSEWGAAFERERDRLRRALSGSACEIEHVGSTSVPGLRAKPILDIAIAFPAGAGVRPLFAPIEGLDYRYRGDAGAEGGHVFVREARPLVRTHHLHLVARDDPQWDAYLLLRDLLRHSPEARKAYEREKVELAERYPADRRAYSDGKRDIVRRLLDEARERT